MARHAHTACIIARAHPVGVLHDEVDGARCLDDLVERDDAPMPQQLEDAYLVLHLLRVGGRDAYLVLHLVRVGGRDAVGIVGLKLGLGCLMPHRLLEVLRVQLAPVDGLHRHELTREHLDCTQWHEIRLGIG